MDAAVEQNTDIDATIRDRIVTLGMDARLEKFSRVDDNERLEVTRRREAEERFRGAFGFRTWWRLDAAERAHIKAVVTARNPWLYTRPDSAMLEAHCRDEVLRILENSSHAANL